MRRERSEKQGSEEEFKSRDGPERRSSGVRVCAHIRKVGVARCSQFRVVFRVSTNQSCLPCE